MTTFTARARRSGGWWALDVPALPGAYSQVRRLDQAPEAIADALSALLERHIAPDDVMVIPDLGTSGAVVTASKAARAEVARRTEEVATLTRRAIEELSRTGLSVRDIGVILGLSHQRVQQLQQSSGRDGGATSSRMAVSSRASGGRVVAKDASTGTGVATSKSAKAAKASARNRSTKAG